MKHHWVWQENSFSHSTQILKCHGCNEEIFPVEYKEDGHLDLEKMLKGKENEICIVENVVPI